MRRERRRHETALAGGVGVLLLAATLLAGAAEPEPRYRVEVLVFAREVPPNPAYRWAGEPAVDGAIELPEEVEPPAPGEAGFPQLVRDDPFAPTEPRSIEAAASRLDRLPGYRLLTVRAWEQEAEVFGSARSVRLHSELVALDAPQIDQGLQLFGEPAEAVEPTWLVDGTVTFERGRFPHLGVDLVYRRPTESLAMPAEPFRAPALNLNDVPYEAYRITQRQRVELGTLTYFDHPQFGVVSVVTRLDDPGASPSS